MQLLEKQNLIITELWLRGTIIIILLVIHYSRSLSQAVALWEKKPLMVKEDEMKCG
jgi:hypothetical protein